MKFPYTIERFKEPPKGIWNVKVKDCNKRCNIYIQIELVKQKFRRSCQHETELSVNPINVIKKKKKKKVRCLLPFASSSSIKLL